MVDEKAVAFGEPLSGFADRVNEIDGFLVDDQLLEGECQGEESRKWRIDRVETRSWFVLLTTFSSLLSPIFGGAENRGDKTAIELFVVGVRGWEAGLRRRLDNGEPTPE